MHAVDDSYLATVGLWIAGPLLSLVDTAFIGLSGASSQSAQQLAALGPGKWKA